MKHKDGKLGLLVAAELRPRLLDVLLQLLDGVLEGGARVVDLVDNQHALADQVLHLAQRAHVQPLGARHLGAGLLDFGVGRVGERLVQRQADGLDGDVGAAGLLEERAQDPRGHVAATADGHHQVGLEVGQDLGRDLLAQLVHLFFAALVGWSFIANFGIWGTAYIIVGDVYFDDHLDGWRGVSFFRGTDCGCRGYNRLRSQGKRTVEIRSRIKQLTEKTPMGYTTER